MPVTLVIHGFGDGPPFELVISDETFAQVRALCARTGETFDALVTRALLDEVWRWAEADGVIRERDV